MLTRFEEDSLKVQREILATLKAMLEHFVGVPAQTAEYMPAWMRNTLFSGPASPASAPASHSASVQPAPASPAPDRLSVGLGGQI